MFVHRIRDIILALVYSCAKQNEKMHDCELAILPIVNSLQLHCH